MKSAIIAFGLPAATALHGEACTDKLDGIIGSGILRCVTHGMKLAGEVSDRVAFFRKGTTAEIAPPDELFGAPKIAELQKFLAATH
ncbi:hypothetical protein [Rhizobium mayense]|uniref:Uncharacterized protein n=1 Tax=Rhizobium mayense TaxID=1312184 RepID=A0ABT7K485_9HYPH|nr:hypothetical protein [Rhizobium mayense]MDL2403422.1 hypothetical protein [Rhizobium mayense]